MQYIMLIFFLESFSSYAMDSEPKTYPIKLTRKNLEKAWPDFIDSLLERGNVRAYTVPEFRLISACALEQSAKRSPGEHTLCQDTLIWIEFARKYFHEASMEYYSFDLITQKNFHKDFKAFSESIFSSFEKYSKNLDFVEKTNIFLRALDKFILYYKNYHTENQIPEDKATSLFIPQYCAASLRIDEKKYAGKVNAILSVMFVTKHEIQVFEDLYNLFFSASFAWHKKVDKKTYFLIADHYVRFEQWEKAEVIYTETIKFLKEQMGFSSKDLVSLYVQLAYVLLCREKYMEAMKTLEKAMMSGREVGKYFSAEIKNLSLSEVRLLRSMYLTLGYVFFKLQAYRASVRVFERALMFARINDFTEIENLEIIYAHMGLAYFYQKKHLEADNFLQQALYLDQSKMSLTQAAFIKTYVTLGKAHLMGGELTYAADAYNKAIEIYKRSSQMSPQIFSQVYQVLLEEPRLPKALAQMRQLIFHFFNQNNQDTTPEEDVDLKTGFGR